MITLASEKLVKIYRRRAVVNGASISVSSGEIVGLLADTYGFVERLDGVFKVTLPQEVGAQRGRGEAPEEIPEDTPTSLTARVP